MSCVAEPPRRILLSNLPTNHPLLSTPIFAKPNVLNDLRTELEVGESKWMVPSGIPQHNELYKKPDILQQLVDALPEMLERRMSTTHIFFVGAKFHKLTKDVEFPDPFGAWILRWFNDARSVYPPRIRHSEKESDSVRMGVMIRNASNAIEAEMNDQMPEIHGPPLLSPAPPWLAPKLKPSSYSTWAITHSGPVPHVRFPADWVIPAEFWHPADR
ncbi:hypothetical protein GQ600_19615 [Phytophthora cactorum]|nr:hypothetical protein GQ600_19615 [Phytophthora cactorum]